MNRSNCELNSRTKFSYSCGRCRKRKIKCDRQLPYCSSCLEKGETVTCKYDSNPWQRELMVYEPGNAQLRKELGILKTTVTQSTQRPVGSACAVCAIQRMLRWLALWLYQDGFAGVGFIWMGMDGFAGVGWVWMWFGLVDES